MIIGDIISLLEGQAPPSLQEDYDNAGLITGQADQVCTGVLISLDATEEVIREAVDRKCNLVISHHPIVFKGLKKINGKNYVERALILAIKHDIALYAIHTNLDNVINGVNGKMADMLGLVNRRVLSPKPGLLEKLAVFVPHAHREKLLESLFSAGAGKIGNYSECSFWVEGAGSFNGNEQSNPVIGEKGRRHIEPETRVEVIFPHWLRHKVLSAMRSAHPYEEIAYDLFSLQNHHQMIGSGIIGELPQTLGREAFFGQLKEAFDLPLIRYAGPEKKLVRKVALCGGAGSFLIPVAKAAGADAYVTADLKYHEFFDAEEQLLLADIGHYESEQFTIDWLFDILQENFPNFAVLKTGINSNPVRYFIR